MLNLKLVGSDLSKWKKHSSYFIDLPKRTREKGHDLDSMTFDGPVTMPPTDDLPWLISQRDILLAKWLARMTITWKSGVQRPPSPSAPCHNREA